MDLKKKIIKLLKLNNEAELNEKMNDPEEYILKDTVEELLNTPYRKIYETNQYQFIIARHTTLLHLCGYVKTKNSTALPTHVKEVFEDYARDFSDITYNEESMIGFDTAHAGQVVPAMYFEDPSITTSGVLDSRLVLFEDLEVCMRKIINELNENIIDIETIFWDSVKSDKY